MPETLSQSQIDELLNRMRSGDVVEEEEEKPEDKLKEYDFTSPKKFTKDQIKSLSSLYENYARVISSYFSGVLHTSCEVEVAQIEEQRYYEFNNALPDNAFVGIADFKPDSQDYEETTVMMDLSTSFGFFAIDRMLGGTDTSIMPDRPYTDVEMALLTDVMDQSVRYLQEAWQNYVGITTALRSIETNGRFLQAFSPQDVTVIVSLEIKSDNFAAMMNICMLAESLDGLISKFSMRYTRAGKHIDERKEKERRRALLQDIKESDLEIVAVLDTCEMTLGDVLQLQPNDIISLNTKIDSNIRIEIQGAPWFSARLGETDRKKAVKIVDSIEM